MPDPQQQLPFAGQVKIHSLIKILNKGLDLHDMQRKTMRVCHPSAADGSPACYQVAYHL